MSQPIIPPVPDPEDTNRLRLFLDAVHYVLNDLLQIDDVILTPPASGTGQGRWRINGSSTVLPGDVFGDPMESSQTGKDVFQAQQAILAGEVFGTPQSRPALDELQVALVAQVYG